MLLKIKTTVSRISCTFWIDSLSYVYKDSIVLLTSIKWIHLEQDGFCFKNKIWLNHDLEEESIKSPETEHGWRISCRGSQGTCNRRGRSLRIFCRPRRPLNATIAWSPPSCPTRPGARKTATGWHPCIPNKVYNYTYNISDREIFVLGVLWEIERKTMPGWIIVHT